MAGEKQQLSGKLSATGSELSQAQDRSRELDAAYSRLLQEKSRLARSDHQRAQELVLLRQSLEQAQSEVARLSGARGIYTVQPGDSLSSIAAFFYRDGRRWRDIHRANAFLFSSPNLIYEGMVMIIPN